MVELSHSNTRSFITQYVRAQWHDDYSTVHGHSLCYSFSILVPLAYHRSKLH